MRESLVALVAVSLIPAAVAAQDLPTSARIHVTDSLSGEPIEGAQVAVLQLRVAALTDANGDALLRNLPPGDHEFEITMLGYARVTGVLSLDPGSSVEGAIALEVQPFEIEGITFNGEIWSSTLQRSGFYERRQRGLGRYLDREGLEERGADDLRRALQFLLRPGCAPAENESGPSSPRRGASSFGNSGGPIATQVMGMAGSGSDYPVTFLEGLPWMGHFEDIPIDLVEGVEIYRGSAGVPVQYSGWATSCGVVLIWLG